MPESTTVRRTSQLLLAAVLVLVTTPAAESKRDPMRSSLIGGAHGSPAQITRQADSQELDGRVRGVSAVFAGGAESQGLDGRVRGVSIVFDGGTEAQGSDGRSRGVSLVFAGSDGSGGSDSRVSAVSIAFADTQAQPANDLCANAIPFSSLPYTSPPIGTILATTSASDPIPSCGTGGPSKSVWFKWLADATGTLTVDTLGSTYDTALSAYLGDCTGFYPLVCNDDLDSSTKLSRLVLPVTKGQSYYFMVSAPQGNGGGLQLSASMHCSLTCLANVPATGTAGIGVPFVGGSTPSGCSSSPSYDWDFGDGTPHSSQASPTHGYATTGTYNWKLTVSNGGAAPCVKTGTIQVGSSNGLTGTIGIWDDVAKKLWKLDGPKITSLTVEAIPPTGTASVSNGVYVFEDLPAGTYDLRVAMTYDEVTNPHSEIFRPIHPECGNVPVTLSKNLVFLEKGVAVTGTGMEHDIRLQPPLVMVHGISACYKTWFEPGLNTDRWDNWARLIGTGSQTEQKGLISFTPSYDPVITDNVVVNDNDWSFIQNDVMLQIADDMKGLFSASAQAAYPPWYFIGHSQGGLVARVLANATDFPIMKTLRKIFFLGTPNSGSFWSPLETYLSENIIRRYFNTIWPSWGSTPFEAFWGTDGLGWGTDSDHVVAVESVRNVIVRECTGTIFELCTDTPLPGSPFSGHAGFFQHGDLGAPASRDAFLVGCILHEINGLGACALVNSSTSGAQLAVPAGGGLTPTLQSVASQVAGAPANGTIDTAFTVGPTDLLVVNAQLTAGSCTFSLVSPGGSLSDADITAAGGQHLTNELGEWFALPNPGAGTWKVRCAAGTSGASYGFLAQEDSPIAFKAYAMTAAVTAGQSVHLSGQLLPGGLTVSSPTVSAALTDKGGNPAGTVTLLDDGAHQDGAPGDGIFGGDTAALANTGRYSITLTLQGSVGGVPFVRQADDSVDVMPAGHLFTGSFSDSGVDTDGDGNLDSVRAGAQVALPGPGGYVAVADLVDSNGYPMAHAVATFQADTAGTITMPLDFRVQGAPCDQFGGPLSVTGLTLSVGGVFKTLDIWTSPITTQTYSGASFGCVAGTPAPQVTSVQPGSLFPGESAQIALGGTGFKTGAQVQFGSGVTASNVLYASPTLLLADVSVSPSAAPGARDVTVTNADARSGTGTSLFNVASDQPPTVSILYPAPGQSVSGTVVVSASASDDRSVQKVEFYLDGVLSATDTAFPYQFAMDTSGLALGPHSLQAKAYDSASQVGASASVSICVPAAAPTVTGSVAVCLGGRIRLQATGGVGSYQWYKDGAAIPGATSAIYTSASATPADAAAYTVTAKDVNGCVSAPSTAFNLVVQACAAQARSLLVDPAPDLSGSDGNGVLEPGETVVVEPSWKNAGGSPLTLAGTASGFVGPAGASYTLTDAAADYGSIAAGATNDCSATGNCYEVSVSSPPTRPSTHWDAVLTETLSDGDAPTVWPIHIGQSFTDVPKTHTFYKFVERILHNGVTTGCTGTTYCPDDNVFRLQMAVFIARAQAGSDASVPSSGTAQGQPYNCASGGTSLFSDVDPTNPFCRHVHYIYSTGVTTGTSPGVYSPEPNVTRAQMALFISRAIAGSDAAVPLTYGPDPVTGRSYSCNPASPNLFFSDITTSDIFCRATHYLWAKDVISGFPDGTYGPALNVSRGAMAKFLANGFNFQLYGP